MGIDCLHAVLYIDFKTGRINVKIRTCSTGLIRLSQGIHFSHWTLKLKKHLDGLLPTFNLLNSGDGSVVF